MRRTMGWMFLSVGGLALAACGSTTAGGSTTGGGTTSPGTTGGGTTGGGTTGAVTTGGGSTTGAITTGGSTTGSAGQPDPSCIAVPSGIPAALDAGPDVHVGIQVYGSGTQNYTCGFVDAGVAGWGAAVPDAQLFQCGPDGGQVGTHFAGPTWEWTADSSTFVGNKPTDVSVPSPDDAGVDITWLLLPKKSGTDAGVMGAVAYASRIETVGGQVALSDAGCDLEAADAGLVVKIPYNATYIFYYQND